MAVVLVNVEFRRHAVLLELFGNFARGNYAQNLIEFGTQNKSRALEFRKAFVRFEREACTSQNAETFHVLFCSIRIHAHQALLVLADSFGRKNFIYKIRTKRFDITSISKALPFRHHRTRHIVQAGSTAAERQAFDLLRVLFSDDLRNHATLRNAYHASAFNTNSRHRFSGICGHFFHQVRIAKILLAVKQVNRKIICKYFI